MGKGDKRTRRGKIFKGSYGKTRPQRKKAKNTKRSAPRQP
jgi:30S ribosomal protein S31